MTDSLSEEVSSWSITDWLYTGLEARRFNTGVERGVRERGRTSAGGRFREIGTVMGTTTGALETEDDGANEVLCRLLWETPPPLL